MLLTRLNLVMFLSFIVSSEQDNLPDAPDGLKLLLSHTSLAVRTGETIRLNCTVLGSSTSRTFTKITWEKVSQSRLSIGSRLLDNNTIQLEVPDVRAPDSGKYRCSVEGSSGNVLLSEDVNVMVGDSPSRPENLRSLSLNWKICFKWSAVSRTGGLPVKYIIKYRCVTDCGLDDDDDDSENTWHEACKNTSHTPGRELICCLDHVTLFVGYQAVVVAENKVGSTTSLPTDFKRGIETTLSPPLSLRSKATGYGEITIEWTPSVTITQTQAWDVRYVISYHAQGQTTNQTVEVTNTGQNRVRLSDLRPYTKYTVYVAARDLVSGRYGIPAGPLLIYTREESPSDAPRITGWESAVYPENDRYRNVTVKWKLPPRQKWHGILQRFIIEYRKPRRSLPAGSLVRPWGKVFYVNDSLRRSAVVVGLESRDRYEMEMKMCTGAGCSGIGNRITVEALPLQKDKAAGEEDSQLWIMIAVISVVMLLISTAIFALITLLVRRTESKKGSSSARVLMPSCYPLHSMPYKHMKGEMV